MSTLDPAKAIEERINRINHVLHRDYLDEVHSDAEGYIDALYDFEMISEDMWNQFKREARQTREKMQNKLDKKSKKRR